MSIKHKARWNAKDHTGKRFGSLVALERIPKYYNNQTAYRCVCDCGSECFKLSSSLVTGDVKSCGCKMNKRKVNDFEINDNITRVYFKCGNSFIIDSEDYNKIKDYYWSYDGKNYAYSKIMLNGKGSKIYLHRLILDLKDKNKLADHINGDSLDNRKSNLRVVTPQQNAWNHKKPSTNTSGVVGVSKSGSKWEASIIFKGENIKLGRFAEFEDAVKSRLNAEKKYYGDYRRNYADR